MTLINGTDVSGNTYTYSDWTNYGFGIIPHFSSAVID